MFPGKQNTKRNRGFSLVQVLVGTAVFLIVSVSIYGAYISILEVVEASRIKIVAVDLANEQFEIVRNIPYADVGIEGSIPDGVLTREKTIERDGIVFDVLTTVRNYDDPFDGVIDGDPDDLSPADNKIVQIEIDCEACRNFDEPLIFTSRVAPKNLETASENGALFVSVLDADGSPVQGADVHIENNQGEDPIVIDDTTNNDGVLQIVDAPPAVKGYEISISKEGDYNTDRTYSSDELGGSTPTKKHATVVLQQLTERSFFIDFLSDLSFSTVGPTCSNVGSLDFNLRGSKRIGTDPDVLKYDADHITNGSGNLDVFNLEWDTYGITVFDGSYDLAGTEPIFPFSLEPGTIQNVMVVVAPKNPRSLKVDVIDSSTDLPISYAEVTLEKSGEYTLVKTTDRGSLTQTDWSGGPGQTDFENESRYLSSDGNLEVNNPEGDVKLSEFAGQYQTDGYLVSSTFDTGSPSNFRQLIWGPSDQPPEAGADSIKMQIATDIASTTTEWTFLGPDGTASSYYTTPNSTINDIHDGDRFLRYKLFLHTDDDAFSPNVSEVSFTFTSECSPPGQVLFSGLDSGGHNISVILDGYEDYDALVDITEDWQSYTVQLISE